MRKTKIDRERQGKGGKEREKKIETDRQTDTLTHKRDTEWGEWSFTTNSCNVHRAINYSLLTILLSQVCSTVTAICFPTVYGCFDCPLAKIVNLAEIIWHSKYDIFTVLSFGRWERELAKLCSGWLNITHPNDLSLLSLLQLFINVRTEVIKHFALTLLPYTPDSLLIAGITCMNHCTIFIHQFLKWYIYITKQ